MMKGYFQDSVAVRTMDFGTESARPVARKARRTAK